MLALLVCFWLYLCVEWAGRLKSLSSLTLAIYFRNEHQKAYSLLITIPASL